MNHNARPVAAVVSQTTGFKFNQFESIGRLPDKNRSTSEMSTTSQPIPEPKKRLFSIDTWAVLLALAAALLVRSGVLSHVPW
jgi:hypothetical protein